MRFIRSVKSNDIATWMTLASVVFFCKHLQDFNWGTEFFVTKNIGILIIYFSAFLLNHIIFRVEHGWSNNFLGRISSDMAISYLSVILGRLYWWLVNNNPILFSYDDGVSFFFSSLLLAFFTEVFFFVVKWGLRRAGNSWLWRSSSLFFHCALRRVTFWTLMKPNFGLSQ